MAQDAGLDALKQPWCFMDEVLLPKRAAHVQPDEVHVCLQECRNAYYTSCILDNKAEVKVSTHPHAHRTNVCATCTVKPVILGSMLYEVHAQDAPSTIPIACRSPTTASRSRRAKL
jgi:hypothetical protein